MAAVLSSGALEAITEIEAEFDNVGSEADGDGGAYIRVEEIEIGERWTPQIVPIEFQVLFNYPFAVVYPYYTVPELERADGGPWPDALQKVQWRERQVTQISLRSNNWQPQYDTAVNSLRLVCHWFQSCQ